jgi:hypothetical protein
MAAKKLFLNHRKLYLLEVQVCDSQCRREEKDDFGVPTHQINWGKIPSLYFV